MLSSRTKGDVEFLVVVGLREKPRRKCPQISRALNLRQETPKMSKPKPHHRGSVPNYNERQTNGLRTSLIPGCDSHRLILAMDRQYEVVVLGATGYTGKYTAEHITTSLPTDLRWAVAGRSESKLKQILSDLKNLNADRPEPGIEIATLQKDDLLNLAKKTKVLITTIGPYHKYGSVVFEACAETGTHYLDVTGEIPWVYDMVQKYHQTAKENGSVMIPQNGIESAPTDLMCWMLASHIKSTLGVGTGEIINTLYDIKATASGGTLATALTLFDTYGVADMAKSQGLWAMCPVPPPKPTPSKPLMEKLTGIRDVSGLGTLTDSVQGPADTPIVGRSWGLHDQGRLYGPNFHLSSYMKARNYLTGFAFHITLVTAMAALILPPVRWLIKNFVYQPGEGPTKE